MAIATPDKGGRAILGIRAGVSRFVELQIDRRRPAGAMREGIVVIRVFSEAGRSIPRRGRSPELGQIEF